VRVLGVCFGGSASGRRSMRRRQHLDVGGRRTGDVYQRRPPDPPEELPNLSSTRTDWTDVALDVSGRAPVGTFHQGQGGKPADAAMVRRSTTRSGAQRSVAASG